MKQPLIRALPQIVIVAVIVAVGASIVAGQLGLAGPKAQTSSAVGQAPRPASSAAPSGAPARPNASAPAGAPAQQGQVQGQTQSPGNGASAPRQASARTIAVRVEEVRRGDLSNYTKLHGDVVSATEVKIYPSVAGKLLESRAAVGDRVEKGSVLALVDPSKIGQTYLPNPVESTVAGTVLSLPVHEGDTVGANTLIATIGDLSTLRILTAVPERFVGQLRIGGSAELGFDALPNAVFRASIASLSPVLDPLSRTREVKLQLDRHDPRILVGMFATVKLVTESRSKALIAPRKAVILATGESYVYVLKEGESGSARVEKRPVKLGMEGEDAFEILSGLSAGEKIVTEGSSSVVDGDSVRVINGKDGTSR